MRHPYFDVAVPTVIGHRGSAGDAPENTLASFALGLETGAAILESDVHLTRDGVPVLLHDDFVDRTTDGRAASPRSRWPSCGRSTRAIASAPMAAARTRSVARACASRPGGSAGGLSEARFNLELKEGLPAWSRAAWR